MSWVHVPHVCMDIAAVLQSILKPVGSVWACPSCGQRWRKAAGGMVRTGLPVTPRRPVERRQVTERPPRTMAELGARERREALAWLDRHVDGVYRDLGLTRSRP